jgi:hypothetical protein
MNTYYEFYDTGRFKVLQAFQGVFFLLLHEGSHGTELSMGSEVGFLHLLLSTLLSLCFLLTIRTIPAEPLLFSQRSYVSHFPFSS